MQKNTLNILKFLFFLGIGVLLIWLPLRNLTDSVKTEIVFAFKQADYFWISISLLIGILSHVVRAMRWKLLLQPLGFNPKLSNTFFAVMIGYLANYALRLGEPLRCVILTRYEKIPFTEGFGTVIVERVIDLICLIIIMLLTLIVQFDLLYNYVNTTILLNMKTKMLIFVEHPAYLILIALILMVAVFLFIKFKNRQKGNNKFINMIKGLIEGLKSIKNIKQPYLFITYSAIIWMLYTASLYVGFLCLKETSALTIGASFAVLIFSTIGVIFVPGGTGASQILITESLTNIFKISYAPAFAFAWLLWTSQFVLILLLGVISLILLPLLNKTTDTQQG